MPYLTKVWSTAWFCSVRHSKLTQNLVQQVRWWVEPNHMATWSAAVSVTDHQSYCHVYVHHFTMVTWSMHTSEFHVLCCKHELSFVVCEYKYSATYRHFIVNIKYNMIWRILSMEIRTRKDTVQRIVDNFQVCFLVIQYLQINTILTDEQIPKKRFLAITTKASSSFRRNIS